MPVLGLSHLTFIVRDVDRTARLFCEGLGAQEVYDSQGRNFSLSREKFVLLGGLWLAFMEGEPPSERTYRHVAFAVVDEDLPACEARLRALGAEVKPPRPRVEARGSRCTFTTLTTTCLSCTPARWRSGWRGMRWGRWW